MNILIKTGSRVDVNFIITESWESKATLLKGKVLSIKTSHGSSYLLIGTGRESSHEEFTQELPSGYYSTLSHEITLTK